MDKCSYIQYTKYIPQNNNSQECIQSVLGGNMIFCKKNPFLFLDHENNETPKIICVNTFRLEENLDNINLVVFSRGEVVVDEGIVLYIPHVQLRVRNEARLNIFWTRSSFNIQYR